MAFWHNGGMTSPWLSVVLVLALAYGCSTADERPPVRKSPPAAKSVDAAAKRAVYGDGTLAEALAQAQKTGGMQPKNQKVDKFGLPLMIELDAPDVPPEIRNPSPPAKQERRQP
jgi:hypothetical protein